jgi:hypothetical protein
MIMKKTLLLIALFALPFVSKSQYKWEYGGGFGAANYLGEIGGQDGPRRDFVSDMKLGSTRYNFMGYTRYKLHKAVSIKGQLLFLNISGDDKFSVEPSRVGRNLNFSTNIIEASVQAEWNFFSQSRLSGGGGMLKGRKKKTDFRSYIFAGAGAFYYNPTTTINGTKYNLRDYNTEGVSYSPIGISFPMGIGLAYTIDRKYRFSFDLGYRVTNTDYLDDASTQYADKKGAPLIEQQISNPNMLFYANNPNATPANSNGEALPPSANYGYDYFENRGTKRGDPKNRDGYVAATLTFGYIIKGKNKYYKSKYKNIANRRKVVKKKTRAKF